MPRPCPHPNALFSLRPVPGNERAKMVVSHPDNAHLVSILSDNTQGLDVCFDIYEKPSKALAVLGRGTDVDIFIAYTTIAKCQCSFEIDIDTGVVMFYDRSFARSTQVFGENVVPFEQDRIRRVLVQKNLNTIIGMGGKRHDLVQFELEWHQDPKQAIKRNKSHLNIRIENPRLARTNSPSCWQTLPHTPGSIRLKMRYVIACKLGSGAFGDVHKAIDVDSGNYMAVKILRRPTSASKQAQNSALALKREVEILSNFSHPHIVDYIASQGWDEPEVEIFMGLKEGTLESLIDGGADNRAVALSVFPQMLSALDRIAIAGIIHRDVKPENILYISHPGGQCQFQLGDFGLSNRQVTAVTFCGTPIYMAPEMHQAGLQTSKADVWSLFVTMLWTLDIRGFRQIQFNTAQDAQSAALYAASHEDQVSGINEMAIVNPEKRASAAQMLVKCFNGEGLSTPWDQIPALSINS